MIIVWALSWWYGAGWKAQLVRLEERLTAAYDYLSIGLLFHTLFAPFRQISAGKVSGPLYIQWRAFVDKTISRVIGAIVRSILIVVGSVFMVLSTVVGVGLLAIWAVVPILPFIGFVFMLSGWVPTWR
jgi:hypothetical protein